MFKTLNSSFSGQRNVTQFQGCKSDPKNSLFDKSVPAQFLSQNFPDFCMRSEEKSIKFSVENAEYSPGENSICEGKFGNIEM